MKTASTSSLLFLVRRLFALLLCLPLALTQAASTDLADIPLANSSTSQIKPNILFILDNSGSMAWGDMPDEVCRDGYYDSPSCVGYQNHQCNLMYYNPGLTYQIPLTSGGTNVNNASPSTFTNALKDGFYSYRAWGSSTRVNLSNAYPDPVNSNLTGTAFYWAYTGPGTRIPRDKVCTYRFQYYWTASTGLCAAINNSGGAIYLDGSGNPSIREVSNSPASCSSLTGAPNGTTWQLIFKRQSVTSTSGPGSTDERQNFANWYSYYRTRMNTMKSASGRAFRQVTDKNRVGFITIAPGSPVSSDYFLPIADFTSSQKNNWYNKLYSQVGSTSTPLRTALARAGRYYAGKHDGINSGMDDDPIQYSCQQNYAILTTDGYWNSTVGYRLDGTAMTPNSESSTSCSSGATDNYDGNISELDAYNSGPSRQAVSARPIFDGSQVVSSSQSIQYQYQYSPYGGTWGQWCNSGSKRYIQYRTVTTTVNTTYTDSTYTTQVGSPTTVGPTTGDWTPYSNCSNNPPALPSPNPGPAPLPDGCAAWPCVTTGPGTNGSCNSLSDVAQYYYKTDLRPSGSTGALGTDVSTNNVIVTPDDQLIKRNMRPDEADKANWQHMTTFTMGLGLSGQLTFDPDYWKRSTTTGHYVDIRNGTRTWPTPVGDSPTALDDLWHAAVNGRGRYFSVADPDSISSAIRSILDQIETSVGASAAAATSSLEPVAGNNFAYTPKYTTREWSGDLEAHQIDLTTGVVDSTYPAWSAQTKLDCLKKSNCDYTQANLRSATPASCDNRTIKLFRSGATNNMVDFKWDTYACDDTGSPTGSSVTGLNASEQAYVSSTVARSLTQAAAYTTDQNNNATGPALVNYLRGQYRFEKALEGQEGKDSADATSLFRGRAHVMGDVVDSKPVYVGPPVQSYTENDYDTFKSSNTSRTPMIYVGANDGMLHAFYAGTITVNVDTNIPTSDALGGQEAWAFMPTSSLPSLYTLADDNYPNAHLYFVDGSPTAADVYDSSSTSWKTILVGGMNKGGKAYYGLDITDPANPKALWEFKWSSTCYNSATSSTWGSDCHLGYTFGKPVVTKLANGTWVVLVTSGYNNVNSPAIAGDGQGYLYVLNALTGQIIYKLGTGVGSSSTPSGLAGIAAWVDNPTTNNTTQRVYGTDLLGNIWRFDVNDSINPSGREATLVATAKDSSGTAQPITTKPLLASYNSSPYVIVATGKYLGNSDLSTSQTQSLYMFLDNLGTTAYADLRASLRQNSITNSGTGAGTTRTISCSSNCTSSSGWFLDWPDTRERVSTDMQLQLGILLVGSNVPKNDACLTGGYSYLNYFDFANGLALPSSTGGVVGQYMAASLVVGLNVVRLPNGNTVAIGTTSKGDKVSTTLPTSTSTGTGAPIGTRVSWREIQQ